MKNPEKRPKATQCKPEETLQEEIRPNSSPVCYADSPEIQDAYRLEIPVAKTPASKTPTSKKTSTKK